MEDVLVLEMGEEVVEEVSKGWRLSWLLLLWWLLLMMLLVLGSKMVVVVIVVVVVGGGGASREGGGGERGALPPPQFPPVFKLPNPLTGMSVVSVVVSGGLPWRWWCWWWRLLEGRSPLGRRTPPPVPRCWLGLGCCEEAWTRLETQGGLSTPLGVGEDSVEVGSCVWAGITRERTGWGWAGVEGSVEERPGIGCSRWCC